MSLSHIQDEIRGADSPLPIMGSGSRLKMLGKSVDQAISTQSLNRIIQLEPQEFVVTAEAGVPVSDLQNELAAHGLRLPFDTPFTCPASTLGGLVATNWTGSSRAFDGAIRDHVFGVKFINAAGNLIQSGGTVVKNVAGYDLSKLLSGSFGRLGLIAQVSLRAVPVPPLERTLVFEGTAEEALMAMTRLMAQPLNFSAMGWNAGRLSLRISGLEKSVEERSQKAESAAKLSKLETLDQDASRQLWLNFNPVQAQGWRISIPRDQAPLFLNTVTRFDWGGALVWADILDMEHVETTCGHGIHFGKGLTHRLGAVDQIVRRALDPHGRFIDLMDS